MTTARGFGVLAILAILVFVDTSTGDECSSRRLFPFRLRGEVLVVEPPEQQPAPKVVEGPKEFKLPPVDKDLRVNVKNIANLIREGKLGLANKLAAAVAPNINDFADLEHLFRPRSKGGLGWGPLEGKNPATDGIEKEVLRLAKGYPAEMALNNIEAAYWLAAMGELALVKAPKKDVGKKTVQRWMEAGGSVRAGAIDLARAFEMNNPDYAKKAAAKINSACAACHTLYKE